MKRNHLRKGIQGIRIGLGLVSSKHYSDSTQIGLRMGKKSMKLKLTLMILLIQQSQLTKISLLMI